VTNKERKSNHKQICFYQQLSILYFFFFFKIYKNDDYDRSLKCGIKFLEKSCFEQSKYFVHNLSAYKKFKNQAFIFFIHGF